MNPIKQLAGQTAIYGLSSIVARLINYLLAPVVFTRAFASTADFGIVTELYAYVAFVIIVLTHGMETAFFRYHKDEGQTAYNTAFLSVFIFSILFWLIAVFKSNTIAAWISYAEYSIYIQWFATILAFDAIASIVFAKLRADERPILFAVYKILNIGVNVILVLILLEKIPGIDDSTFLVSFKSQINTWFPGIGKVGYVFLSNLAASTFALLLLVPFIQFKFNFNITLWKKMAKYGFPILLVGLAGVTNDSIDKIMLKYLLPYSNETNMSMLGVYGACYKLSVLMTLFVQAFRFAGEPFFFKHADKENATQIYADVMKCFVIIACCIFLGVGLFLDLFKYFIDARYWGGLYVVPILLFANLLFGVYYNLSVWYKVKDKTKYGAYISIGGGLLTIVLNFIWIPVFGYVGSAWATLVCFSFMVTTSYFIGKKFLPVPYDLKRLFTYLLLSVILILCSQYFSVMISKVIMSWIFNGLLFIVFAFVAYILDIKTLISKSFRI